MNRKCMRNVTYPAAFWPATWNRRTPPLSPIYPKLSRPYPTPSRWLSRLHTEYFAAHHTSSRDLSL